MNRWAWRLLIAQAGVLLATFTLFRLAFLVMYRASFAPEPAGEVLVSLLAGLRFDASALAAYLGLPALLFFLLSPLPFRRWVYWVQFGLVAALAIGMFVLLSVDLFYYAFVGRRVSFEVVAMANDWRPIAVLIGRAYPWEALGMLLLLFALLALAVRRFHQLERRPYRPVAWWSHGLQSAALALLLAVAARGGVQVKPISENMAFRSGNLALGHLSLNAVFTATKAFGRGHNQYRLLPEAEAEQATLRLLGLPSPPAAPGYPLWRRVEVPPVPRPRNLVVIVIESWSPQLIGVMGGAAGVTPRFDALTREGMFFPNFYANGTRSLEGVAAIVTGYPALPNAALIGSSLEQNAMTSLSGILKRRGYRTLFVHGAYRGSMWFDNFAARHGFDKYVAKEDFPDPKGMSDSTWGIFDHYALERLHQELEAGTQPFFGFFFSLSSHTPYELPDPKFAKFPAGAPGARMLNSFHYTDEALGRFFDLARRSSYWKDTVFIVTGDHNMGGPFLNRRQSMHIPLLIVNPADPAFPKGVNPTLGSQAAIAPTALQLLGISASYDFPATSLLAPAAQRFALFAWGGTAGWINDQSLLVHDLTQPIALYRWRKDPALRENVLGNPAAAGDTAAADFAAYLQTVNNLLVRNRVAPRDAPP
jgi:phosphoglycerol transferase MdoB-like AlkP superfamily enzyme